jgi:hypothetical protein
MKHTKLAMLLALLVALCPGLTLAQVRSTELHPVSPLTVIHGATSPNQIPDEIAYRLYFMVLTNEAQEANVNALGLSSTDKASAIRILNEFRTQDTRVRESHAALAVRKQVNPAAFHQERADLVDTTRQQLREALSLEGMQTLDAAIQLNKSNITLKSTQEPTTTDPSVATPTRTAAVSGVPNFEPPPKCGAPRVTWSTTTAMTTSYNVTAATPGTNATMSANIDYDGVATPTVTWPPSCIPDLQDYPTPTYKPHVYNQVSATGSDGTWITGPPVVGGGEFNVGQVVTIVIVEINFYGYYSGGYGDGLDGFEGIDDGTDYPVIVETIIIVQLEIADTRSAFTGTKSGCVNVPNSPGIQACTLSQQNWCTAASSPPDLNIFAVVTDVPPVPPFFENYAACFRPGLSGPWHCGPAFSVAIFNQAPGLQICTKTP